MENNDIKSGKTSAVISYFYLLGVLIAYLTNAEKKSQFAYFHIRQSLGLWLTFLALGYPVGYFDMIELLKAASLVMTDSGGLQKEAYFFSNPCITMRDETEWVELVSNGYNKLAGASKDKILKAYQSIKDAKLDFTKDLYGRGQASKQIADVLVSA